MSFYNPSDKSLAPESVMLFLVRSKLRLERLVSFYNPSDKSLAPESVMLLYPRSKVILERLVRVEMVLIISDNGTLYFVVAILK